MSRRASHFRVVERQNGIKNGRAMQKWRPGLFWAENQPFDQIFLNTKNFCAHNTKITGLFLDIWLNFFWALKLSSILALKILVFWSMFCSKASHGQHWAYGSKITLKLQVETFQNIVCVRKKRSMIARRRRKFSRILCNND